MSKKVWWILIGVSLVLLALLTACQGPAGTVGPAGATGAAGPQGVAGPPGPLPPATERQLKASISVSKPANGTHFVAGEKAVVTVTLEDQVGNAIVKADLATLALYMFGPQETSKTVTAVKLLNATTDRTKTPHHYIDLLKNENVQVKGSVLEYALQPVSDEEPGTYIVALRATPKGNDPQQKFELYSLQIGTATVEKPIVEKEKCATCHLGSSNGQYYMHHVDPGRSPYGSPAIDSVPVTTCNACHNNDGYAAYNDASAPGGKTPDQTVKRVHGVHFGEELSNPVNTDLTTGLYKNYRGVVFPKDIRNCTACHVDDRWKTKPSRMACGACHDNVNWATGKSVVTGKPDHEGGPQANDAGCAVCHTPDKGSMAPIAAAHDPAINVEHDDIVVTMSPPKNGKFYVAGEKPMATIVIKDSKGNPIDHTGVTSTYYAGANFYVFGPRSNSIPVLTLAAKTGIANSRASATNSIPASGTPAGWTFDATDTFKIAVNRGAIQTVTATAGLQTPDQVAAWLKANLKDVTVTGNAAAGTVNIQSSVTGDNSRLEIYNSGVVTKMGWKPIGLDITEHGVVVGKTVGTTMEPFVVIGTQSTVPNDLRSTTDTNVVRTAKNVTYQLDDVAGLKPGTYMAYSYANLVGVKTKNGWARDAFGITTFQVGTETPEPKVAANCTACHGNTVMHLNERNVHPGMFDADYCKACHDYGRPGTGEGYSRTGGTSTNGWAGYGSKPISARIHGVHFGAYLNRPQDVYAGNPNMASEIIFPQDVRNCTVCHDKTTSGTWKTEPSRMACMSCHDSDSARAHGTLMTVIPPGADPLGSTAVESCKACHGAGTEFSPDKVHNIANPYKPPYPREE